MMNGVFGKLNNRMRDASGAAIALVALAMVALLSAVALAVDVGMMVTARTEAATLADASALAGAGVLRDLQGDSAAAHAAAISWAAANTVRGETVTLLDEDVDVIPEEWTVRVRVHRTEARGNAVPTFFARIFGVDQVNITARAAAWAAPATSSGGDPTQACLLPLALVDEFIDVNGNGIFDDGDLYDPENGIGGYDENDHGKLIKLKIHNNNPNSGPPACQTDDDAGSEVANEIDYCQDGGDSSSWRCWWREDLPADGGGGGTDVLGPRIYPGDECGPEMSLRDTVWAASGSGNKQSLVSNDDDNHHFEALIQSDPDLEWCDDCANGIDRGCVVENGSTTCYEGDSPRMRSSPVVDPTIDGGGSNTYSVIENFIGVFVEQVSCAYDAGPFGGPEGQWNVYVRLMVEGGSGSSGEEGSSEESLLRNLQLIE